MKNVRELVSPLARVLCSYAAEHGAKDWAKFAEMLEDNMARVMELGYEAGQSDIYRDIKKLELTNAAK